MSCCSYYVYLCCGQFGRLGYTNVALSHAHWHAVEIYDIRIDLWLRNDAGDNNDDDDDDDDDVRDDVIVVLYLYCQQRYLAS